MIRLIFVFLLLAFGWYKWGERDRKIGIKAANDELDNVKLKTSELKIRKEIKEQQEKNESLSNEGQINKSEKGDSNE